MDSWMMISLICFFVFIYALPIFNGKPLTNISIEDLKDDNITFMDEQIQKEYATFLEDELSEIRQLNEHFIRKDASDKKRSLRKRSNRLTSIRRQAIQKLNRYDSKLKKIQNTKGINNETEDNERELMESISKIQHDLAMTDTLENKQYKWHEAKKKFAEKAKLANIKNLKEFRLKQEQLKSESKKNITLNQINEPGSEDQLKEIWKNIDSLDSDFFNVKTFFNLHDLNQDGHWDIEEIEAIVFPGIQKYIETDSSIDSEEQFHEIKKMRQHFMIKIDKNKDQLISFDEFEKYSGDSEFKKNEHWKGFDELEGIDFSEDEIRNFEKELESISNTTAIEE